jgi:hypothetical protein
MRWWSGRDWTQYVQPPQNTAVQPPQAWAQQVSGLTIGGHIRNPHRLHAGAVGSDLAPDVVARQEAHPMSLRMVEARPSAL